VIQLIQISEINIPEDLELTVNELYECHLNNGEDIYNGIYSPIILDSDLTIIRGMETYLTALSLDIQMVKVEIMETRKNKLTEKFKLGIAA
jgi:hypothetical protein